MGFLDKIKQQATDVATTVVEKTQDTAKTGQLQMQLRSLKSEEKDALADLGAAMMALGDTPDSLADQTSKCTSCARRSPSRSRRSRTCVRAEGAAADESADTVESDAEEVAEARRRRPRTLRRPSDAPAG